ncbi:MAG: outer membrane beta-barrel protein [Planctomycetes bacterium]|nr:outer membrane beta-barrel protein [Planctomycetota bacterium]
MLETLFLSAALTLGQVPPPPPPIPSGGNSYSGQVPPPPPPVPHGDLLDSDETPEPLGNAILQVSADQPAPQGEAPKPEEIAAPLLPPPAAPAAAAAAAAPTAAAPPRWFLMKALQGTYPGAILDSERTQILGWVQGSYTASSVGDLNFPESQNFRANQFMMNQAWFRLARSVVTTGTEEPTFGFESDWYVGTDYRYTLSRGVFNHQLVDNNGSPNLYGVDPIQFFGEAYFPTVGRGLDLKVGRFYAPWGVESIEAPSTPFLSHSYTFSLAPPFTLTGILSTLTVTPEWTVQAGLVAGEDVILFNTADTPTFVGTVQWTQPEGGRNVVKFATVLNNADFFAGAAFQNYDIFDVVWTHIFNEVLVYNMEAIYGFEDHIVDVGPPAIDPNLPSGRGNWEGLAQYLAYTMSARLVAQVRFELFNDPQGVRTSGFTIAGSPAGFGDTKGLYEALTLGLVFMPRTNKSIILRPEIRWDHNDESAAFQGHHNLFTAATDLIVRW